MNSVWQLVRTDRVIKMHNGFWMFTCVTEERVCLSTFLICPLA